VREAVLVRYELHSARCGVRILPILPINLTAFSAPGSKNMAENVGAVHTQHMRIQPYPRPAVNPNRTPTQRAP